MQGTDRELLEAWRAGDRKAGDALFGRYFRSLFVFFSSKASDAVEDLIGRTMTACLQSLHRFRDDGSFRSYLFGIARHELFGHYRRLRTEDAIDFGVTSVCDLAPGPSQWIHAHEEQQALVAALRQLPLELQITLELHYWEDLTTAELAVALEIPQGTVKSRLRRAREALAERMRAGAEAPEVSVDALERWVRSVRAEADHALDR